MDSDRPGCEEFEIAALRQSLGALDAASQDRLAAHLAACPGCRRFAATAQATQAALRRRTRAVLGDPGRDAGPALAALRKRLADGRARIVRSLVVAAVVVALQFWSGGLEAALVVGGMAVVIVCVGLFTVILPRRRQALAASAVEGDLVAYVRADLDREIEGLRKTRPYLIVLGLMALLLLVVTSLGIAKDMAIAPKEIALAKHLVPLAIFGLVGFRLWYDVRHRLPMLEHERESLA